MKSPLQFLMVICAFLLLSSHSYAQSTAEPTIDSSLDVIQNLSTQDEDGTQYSIIVKGFNKIGQTARIVMKLDNPADAQKFTLTRLVNNVPTIPIEFGTDGVGVIKTDYVLVEDDPNAAVLEIKFSEAGIFNYELQLIRNDEVVISRMRETVRVASVAGLDDMIENTQVKVYPVPSLANDEVTLNLGALRNASVIVMDALGKQVYRTDNVSGATKINTAGFSKGIYFVKVVKGTEAAMVRMVVQ